jgi:hypothetical protein
MRVSGLTGALLGICATIGFTASGFQQQKTALVTVVADADKPIADLTAKDFVVKEDGKTREVVAAERMSEPLFITLLVDTSQPAIGVLAPTQDLRRALSAFVQTIKGGAADAQIAMITLAGASVTKVDFTAEPGPIDKEIQRMFPSQQSDAVVIEALVDAGKKLSEKPSPRRAIVAVDFNSPDTSAPRTMKAAAEDIRKAGATVWSASIRGTLQSTSTREEVLNVVTRSSGGTRLSAVEPTGLESMLKSIANSLLSQYSLTFIRPDAGPVKSAQAETTRGQKVLFSPWMR